MARLRERGRDGCLAGIQVQQLFCSNNTTIPEHQLKELNMKIDDALQVCNHPKDQGEELLARLFQWLVDLKTNWDHLQVKLHSFCFNKLHGTRWSHDEITVPEKRV